MGLVNRVVWAGIIAIVLYVVIGVFFSAQIDELFFSEFGFLVAVTAMFIEITFVKQ